MELLASLAAAVAVEGFEGMPIDCNGVSVTNNDSPSRPPSSSGASDSLGRFIPLMTTIEKRRGGADIIGEVVAKQNEDLMGFRQRRIIDGVDGSY
jgi:hypothetical protein